MKNPKKEFFLKFLIVAGLIGGASIFILIPLSGFLWPNEPEEILIDKMMRVWCLSWFVPGGLFMFLMPIWGLKQQQNKPQKLILDINNFDDMKSYITGVLYENKFEIIDSGFVTENEQYIFFLKDTGINIECFLLTNAKFYCDEKAQIVTEKANKIYEERFKMFFSRRAFSGYTIVCVNKVDNEFYKYLQNVNESVPRERFYFSGYTFGGKILYLPQYKDSFASGELKKMQQFLENIFKDRTDKTETQSGDGSVIES